MNAAQQFAFYIHLFVLSGVNLSNFPLYIFKYTNIVKRLLCAVPIAFYCLSAIKVVDVFMLNSIDIQITLLAEV